MFDIQVPRESFTYLDTLKAKYPKYNQIFSKIETNINNSLWHQLTDDLIELSSQPDLQNSNDLIDLYTALVQFVERAMNPMRLLFFVHKMLSNYQGRMNEALIFIENLEKKIKFDGESKLYLTIMKGFCYLGLERLYDLEDLINAVKEEFEKKSDIEPYVYSYFYRLATYFYEKKENYDEFYLSSFQYLAYEKNIPADEKIEICFKICASSLVGEKMFNFAELIEKDFFKLMAQSKYDWIYNLVLSFNSSKVDQFLGMLNTYANQISQVRVLSEKIDFLKLKIRIAALLDLIFQKNKSERTVTYKEIMDVCKVQLNEIEYVVMKALSLNLIKGSINEVEQKIVINWVQPKYLDKEKIAILDKRFENWIQRANKMLTEFEELGQPLLAQ